jgi:hypothetical protein
VEQVSEVRYVEGKAFTQRGWVEGADGVAIPFWVDTAWDEEVEPERVLFASEEYFDLLQDERVARWLSLSSEMLVVLDDGTVVRISTVAP